MHFAASLLSVVKCKNRKDFELRKIILKKHAWYIKNHLLRLNDFFFSMLGEFVDNCIKLKVWASAPVTLVFFCSIVGAGARIPYIRGIDDVAKFICYRHS